MYWSSILQAWWTHLLAQQFFCELLRIFYIWDCVICKQSLFYLSLFNPDALYLFFLPNCLVRTSSKLLNKSGKSRHPCVFWSQVGNFQSFTNKYDVSWGFFIDNSLSDWESFFIFLVHWVFLTKGILSNALPASIEMIIWFLSFILWIWSLTFINFWILN